MRKKLRRTVFFRSGKLPSQPLQFVPVSPNFFFSFAHRRQFHSQRGLSLKQFINNAAGYGGYCKFLSFFFNTCAVQEPGVRILLPFPSSQDASENVARVINFETKQKNTMNLFAPARCQIHLPLNLPGQFQVSSLLFWTFVYSQHLIVLSSVYTTRKPTITTT